MANGFVGFLKKVGSFFKVAFTDIVKYTPLLSNIITVADPAAAPVVAAFDKAVQLVQNTVITIEQKYAASGAASATGTSKLADVITIVEAPVISFFQEVGVAVDSSYVTNLVNAVVAFLNAFPSATLAQLENAAPKAA